MKICIVVVES